MAANRKWVAAVVMAMTVGAGGLAGCSALGGEKVHSRATSEDGKLHAVVMTCFMDGDAKVKLVTGAVFDRDGGGCPDVIEQAVGSVWVSLPPSGLEAPAASVAWQEGKAVFSFEGERTVVARHARADASLDLIVVSGDFEEADIVEEE